MVAFRRSQELSDAVVGQSQTFFLSSGFEYNNVID